MAWMGRTMMKLLMLVTGMMAASACKAADLTLRVQGEDLRGREVRLALHSSAQSFPAHKEKARAAKAIASGNEVRFHFPDLPPGLYAVSAFADINGNTRLDRNFLGVPTEPYGFSRDARRLAGPPGFEEAAFSVGDTDMTHTFRLQ